MKVLITLAATMVYSAVPQIAAAQTGSAQFCLQGSGGARCVFDTMGDCERARGSASAAQCITRTDARGATGLGEPTVPSATVPSSER
jgi:hypothetical protein